MSATFLAQDLWDRFEAKATLLSATVRRAANLAEAARWLDEAGAWQVPSLNAAITVPGALEETVAVPGLLAVAETGSVLVTLPRAERRAAMLAEHLILVVKAADIVASLDGAVARVSGFINDGNHYLTLMSGPSRTADIERVLTVGVHGPATLTILVVGDPSA